MTTCHGALSLLVLLAACCAGTAESTKPAGVHKANAVEHFWRHLLGSTEEVSSPDVSLGGACAADIVQHCRHLLTQDSVVTRGNTPMGSSHAQGTSGKDQISIVPGTSVQQASVTTANGGTGATAAPASTAGTSAAGTAAADSIQTAKPQSPETAASSTAVDLKAAATSTADGGVEGVKAAAAAEAGAAAGSTAMSQPANESVAAAGGTSTSGAVSATDVKGNSASAAGSSETSQAAAALQGAAQQTQGQTQTSAVASNGVAAAAEAKVGATQQEARGQVEAAHAAGGSATAAATEAKPEKAQQQQQAQAAAVAGVATAAATEAKPEKAQQQPQAQAAAVADGTTAAAAEAKPEKAQQQQAQGQAQAAAGAATQATAEAKPVAEQQQQRRRRQLLAAEADAAAGQAGSSLAARVAGQAGSSLAARVAGQAVRAEMKAVEAHRDDLARALEMLGLHSGLSAAAMGAASAPIARCLRGVMHASEMSISPNIPDVADECKAEVRSVLIGRASDVRYDPPLLAACSHDIVSHCEDIGPDTTAMLGCLKSVKSRLLPLCRRAVTVRQAAAAEDLSLDPDLQRSCGAEREQLCMEAGWGNGAAQACLLGHLRGSLPQVFSEVIFPVSTAGIAAPSTGGTAGQSAAAGGGGGGGPTVELSANCSAALVQRLIEEGEDIRFNYKLSAACAGDKQVLCRDVRPGGAAVLRCLEDHLSSPGMQEDCRDALYDVRQLRSLDVRLDHTFVSSCAADIRSLCGEEDAGALGAGPAEVPFGLWAPFECLRGRLDQVRDATCRRHMYEGVIAAFSDNRLDAGLMRGCHAEVAVLCGQHPARALECLQDKIDKFSREDAPAVLKGKISDTCLAVVLERRQQAATDLAFLPDLMAACAREHATLCAAPGMQGLRALDCLADHRSTPDFSPRCGVALREYLVEAARDIRTMAGLRRDCGEEIQAMCKGVQPGEGRVISCLRDQRSNISSQGCRVQVMRLLGFLVEDHRLDVRLTEACTGDVQKYCGGVEAGGGQVHDCLRRSFDHLSPACRAAEEEVERLEHEDVRLNPRLMRECPLAIRTFCGDVPPGDARVIRCLQSHMDAGHFPPACRAALTQLTDRAATKYSLNFRLRQECEEDTQRLCPDAVDELGSSRQDVTGTGGRHAEETTLACLARQSGELVPACRAELQALVKLSLNRYRVGMPLTSQCDGDVMARCRVDQLAAPFLQAGYVLSCLARHAPQLHRPCWELVSTMDEGQFKRAAAAETSHWQSAQGGAVVDEKVLRKVAADVRRELEPRLYSTVHEQINRRTTQVARNVTGALVMTIAPKVAALMHTTMSLLVLTAVGLVAAGLAWRRFMSRGGGVLVVRKDGRV